MKQKKDNQKISIIRMNVSHTLWYVNETELHMIETMFQCIWDAMSELEVEEIELDCGDETCHYNGILLVSTSDKDGLPILLLRNPDNNQESVLGADFMVMKHVFMHFSDMIGDWNGMTFDNDNIRPKIS